MKKIFICLSILVLLVGCSSKSGDEGAAAGVGRYSSSDTSW